MIALVLVTDLLINFSLRKCPKYKVRQSMLCDTLRSHPVNQGTTLCAGNDRRRVASEAYLANNLTH